MIVGVAYVENSTPRSVSKRSIGLDQPDRADLDAGPRTARRGCGTGARSARPAAGAGAPARRGRASRLGLGGAVVAQLRRTARRCAVAWLDAGRRVPAWSRPSSGRRVSAVMSEAGLRCADCMVSVTVNVAVLDVGRGLGGQRGEHLPGEAVLSPAARGACERRRRRRRSARRGAGRSVHIRSESGSASGSTIAQASPTAIRRSSMSSMVKSRRAARPAVVVRSTDT